MSTGRKLAPTCALLAPHVPAGQCDYPVCPPLRLAQVSVTPPCPGPLSPLTRQHSHVLWARQHPGTRTGTNMSQAQQGRTRTTCVKCPRTVIKEAKGPRVSDGGGGRARRVELQGPSRGQRRDNPTRAPRWRGACSRPASPLQNPSSNPSSSHLPFRVRLRPETRLPTHPHAAARSIPERPAPLLQARKLTPPSPHAGTLPRQPPFPFCPRSKQI